MLKVTDIGLRYIPVLSVKLFSVIFVCLLIVNL